MCRLIRSREIEVKMCAEVVTNLDKTRTEDSRSSKVNQLLFDIVVRADFGTDTNAPFD